MQKLQVGGMVEDNNLLTKRVYSMKHIINRGSHRKVPKEFSTFKYLLVLKVQGFSRIPSIAYVSKTSVIHNTPTHPIGIEVAIIGSDSVRTLKRLSKRYNDNLGKDLYTIEFEESKVSKKFRHKTSTHIELCKFGK